jgi:hypothetical protein
MAMTMAPDMPGVGDGGFTATNGGGTGGARTMTDLRAARETRASEALKMKDEQLRILQEQNSQLLNGLDKVEVSSSMTGPLLDKVGVVHSPSCPIARLFSSCAVAVR